MPVEIRELVIRAVVRDGPAEGEEPPGRADAAEERQRLVEECVEQVLKVLRRSRER